MTNVVRTGHDGDCYFYSLARVCTCGFLHYWMPRIDHPDLPDRYWDDFGKQAESLRILEDHFLIKRQDNENHSNSN